MSLYRNGVIDPDKYQKYRITYPKNLYDAIMAHHAGQRLLAVDVGCGTGIGTFPLLEYFDTVVGCDPSAKMLATAAQMREKLPGASRRRVSFQQAAGEDISRLFGERTLDMITGGESIQYVKHSEFFRTAARLLKPGATLAFWFYADPVFVDYPKANAIFKHCAYEDEHSFAPLWPPEMDLVRNLGKSIEVPSHEFEMVYSEVNFPLRTNGAHSFRVSRQDCTLQDLRDLISTWSVYDAWKKNNKDSAEDVIDALIEKLKRGCGWDDDIKLNLEWETALYVARRRQT
ncbi:LAQU0S17e01046g1_1 [Lachancea quebecensis]|uniref:LAQU0S17e01046g1_1 n=1 Tax=Lachancea quebecensis TaxID=1654605 RepID=A0A0N7MMA2_9SACH|nr:LAQU0S17e01046g1_1 [Lachancea quebecensis]